MTEKDEWSYTSGITQVALHKWHYTSIAITIIICATALAIVGSLISCTEHISDNNKSIGHATQL